MGVMNIQSHLKVIKEEPITINSFKLLNFVGSGGFSQVYKAKFLKTRRLFAIKKISKLKVYKKNAVNHVNEEKEILSELFHPFIINLYCSFQDENNLYFVMDYLGGGDLRYYILNGKKFKEKQIKFILACIFVGLEYIHSKKIIHRDLKPENLIFDDKGYLHICDFGISIREDDNMENIKKIGTKGFIAPEGNNTYLSDLYSIGVILYEIIFGKVYDKNIDMDIIKEEMKNKEFSDDLYQLLSGLLQKNPNERLGYDNDVLDCMNHPFFKDFDFYKLKKQSMLSPIFPKYEPINYTKKVKITSDKISEFSTIDSSIDDFSNFDYVCYNKVFHKDYNTIDNDFKFRISRFPRTSSCENLFNSPTKSNINKIFYSTKKNFNQSIDYNYNNNNNCNSNRSIFTSSKKCNNKIFCQIKNRVCSGINLFKNLNNEKTERPMGRTSSIKLPNVFQNKKFVNGKLLIISKHNNIDKIKLFKKKL